MLYLDDDCRVRLDQSARASGLHQVLVLVVIDVKVIEHRYRTALVGTNIVVRQIHDDAKQIVLLGVIGVCSNLILHYRNSHDLGNSESCSQFLLGIINHTTILVLKKQHVGKHVLGCEQSRIAGASVILTGLDGLSDECLRDLVLCICRSKVRKRSLNGIKLIISPYRTNVIFLDLVLSNSGSAIADQDRTTKFLIQHDTHLTTKPSNYVEIGDVENVITIQLLLLIDGLRIGCSSQKSDNFLDLLLALSVTLCSSLIGSDVSEYALYS